MVLGFRIEVIIGGEVAGIGPERAPGGLLKFFPDLGYVGVSLCENLGSCTLMIYALFCMYVILE